VLSLREPSLPLLEQSVVLPRVLAMLSVTLLTVSLELLPQRLPAWLKV
jgi:hypothetical protein